MLFENVKINDVKISTGQYVKMLRKGKKLTQQELAELLNLSRITIQNLESGRNFTIDTFLKVLYHFDKLSELNDFMKAQTNEVKNTKSLY